MRYAFFGSPPFAIAVFERLLESAHFPVALVTRPDRPRGRGMKVEPSPLVVLAQARGVAVLQPETTKDPAFLAALRTLDPELLLVASYGEILRTDLLELAPHGALNVHASLLPRHRGASPIQAAILAGDAETGVCVQRMVRALDEGDVLLELRTPIGERENASELLARLSVLGGEAAVHALDLVENGEARFTAQDQARATYAKRIAKEAGRIDWNKSALELERFVRAMTPWPAARTLDPHGAELVVLEARVCKNEKQAAPGTLIALAPLPIVACASGALELMRVKPAGKTAMDAGAWLRGARLEVEARFL